MSLAPIFILSCLCLSAASLLSCGGSSTYFKESKRAAEDFAALICECEREDALTVLERSELWPSMCESPAEYREWS